MKAKSFIKLTACAVILAAGLCRHITAGELIPEVDFSISTGIYSKYIWRGQNLGDDWSIQPVISAGYKGASISIFANYDTDTSEWTETDYTLDYTAGLGFIDDSLEGISVSAGYTYYTFPSVEHNLPEHDSHEAYIGAAADILLSPSLFVYYDWDTGDGTYIEGAVSHSLEFERFSVTPGLTLGYNGGQWGYDAGWSSLVPSLAITVPAGKYITIEGTIYESIALDSQYDSEFYGGINLSAEF